MSIQKCVLFIGLVLYMSNQAISLKCYECSSADEGDKCFTEPRQSEFEKSCVPLREIQKILSSEPRVDSIFDKLVANYTRKSDDANTNYQLDCATVQFSLEDIPDRKGLVRACFPTALSCKTLEDAFAHDGVIIELCFRCRTDLCNTKPLL